MSGIVRAGYPKKFQAGRFDISDEVVAFPEFVAPIIFRWRADQVTLASTKVSQLEDLSGNGNHAVQGTAGARALWRPGVNEIKNQPALDFDGSDDFYTVDALQVDEDDPPDYTAYTLWVVCRLHTNANNAIVAVADETALERTGPLLYETGTGNLLSFDGYNAQAEAQVDYPFRYAGGGDTFTRWHSILCEHATGARSITLDNGTTDTGTGAANPGAPVSVKLGRLVEGAFWFIDGEIAEVFLAGGSLTTEEKAALAAYRLNRYGL